MWPLRFRGDISESGRPRAVTVLIAIPEVALISSACGSIISPSYNPKFIQAAHRRRCSRPSVASVRGYRRVQSGRDLFYLPLCRPFFSPSVSSLLSFSLSTF